MASLCVAQAQLQTPTLRRSAALHRNWRVHSSRGYQPASLSAETQQQWHLEVRRGYVPEAVAVSKLLAQAFISSDPQADEGQPPSAPQLLQFQLKLLADMQWRASMLGPALVTITATECRSGQLAGVASLTPGLALADAADHLQLGPGEAAACISSLAAGAAFRRRGLGRMLLAACERAAGECYVLPASVMALAVYRLNEPAVQLYRSSGYEIDDSWMDQRWASRAERGQVGFARRQLMLKPLGGGPLPKRRGDGSGSSSSGSHQTAS